MSIHSTLYYRIKCALKYNIESLLKLIPVSAFDIIENTLRSAHRLHTRILNYDFISHKHVQLHMDSNFEAVIDMRLAFYSNAN